MDSASLRKVLLRTDLTPQAIQRSAAAILGHYDRIPSIAVDDWRQCLTTCSNDQLLPLLYVANEVIQTSKRNRGPKFLEAFGPVLGSSLRLICQRDGGVVEKARRVVKIWGDRRIYSVRFVSEVLKGIEQYREGGGAGQHHQSASAAPAHSNSSAPSPSKASSNGTKPAAAAASPSTNDVKRRDSDTTGPSTPSAHDEDDDEASVGEKTDFSSIPSPGSGLLKVDVPSSAADRRVGGGSLSKRKRSSSKMGGSGSNRNLMGKKKKKKKTLLDMLDELDGLTGQFQLCKSVLNGLPEEYFSTDESSVADMVGDELGNMYTRVANAERTILRQRKKLHTIAGTMHGLEGELKGFVPTLRAAGRQDEQDLNMCKALEEKLKLLVVVHGAAREAREKKKAEEAKKKAAEEAERKKKEEEEANKRELEETLKVREAEPGMVWNPVTKEYQNVLDQTAESWRD